MIRYVIDTDGKGWLMALHGRTGGIAIALLTIQCACQDPAPVPLPQSKELDVQALVEQRLKMSASGKEQSKEALKKAVEMHGKKRWGPAAKLYGESMGFYPDKRAMLGYATSLFCIHRHEDTENAKLDDYEYILKLLNTLEEFARMSGQKLDASEREEISELRDAAKNGGRSEGLCR